MNRRIVVLAVICTATVLLPVAADDWPQFRGPDRTGVSRETGLLKDWPAGGPKLAWKIADLGGESYSAPAVAKGSIYLLSNFDGDEYVVALKEENGEMKWKKKLGKVGKNQGPQYPGPRGTPTVDGDRLYALSSAGELACLDLPKGDIVWTKNLMSDFGGQPGAWAYTESPLVDGDFVVVSPGGKAATVVALHKKDGTLGWKSQVPGGDKAAYGSPIAADVGGVHQYILYLEKGVVGVAAKDGQYLWRFDKTSNGNMNIPTPIYHEGQVFSSAQGGKKGGGGGGVAKLVAANDKVTATPGWYSDELTNHIGGFVRLGDYLYGVTGAKGQLTCIDFKTGAVKWKNPCVGAASLCAADGMLYVRSHDGPVALVEATPDGFKEHGRFTQPDRSKKKCWTYPVLANGHLYLRDVNVLLCYDVRKN